MSNAECRMKKSVEDIDVRSMRVLVRLDLNVPLDDDRKVADDTRIRAALPTVRRLIEGGGRVILMSHLGRPKGTPDDRVNFSLAPVALRLSELLGRRVTFVRDWSAPELRAAVNSLADGDVCLLENLRFNEGETIKDKAAAENPKLRQEKEGFAGKLAEMADVYVNDAFGTCHRDNASMLTVPRLMAGRPRVVGCLVQKELEFLGRAVSDPKRPFICVLGGVKVSDKIGVIENMLDKCDRVLIGGAMMFTFAAAEGKQVGKSLVEPDSYETARSLLAKADDKLRLPIDCIAAERIEEGVDTQVCKDEVPEGLMGLDIGPETISAYLDVLGSANTVVWNGPMGVFETPPFDRGTLAVAGALADATARGAVTIIGGGDSAAAVAKAGLSDKMTHISTGGGASLEFLEGKPFAALEVLDEA
ncbi:MAG: phosphoglycerate kinase [Candidatus Krumholzibacteria bacterium]